MIQSWSYSSLMLLNSCPRSWYAKYVLGEKVPQSEAASFGSQFDRMVAVGLGLPDPKPDNQPLVPGVEEAVAFYQSHPYRIRKAKSAQTPVNINPDQWAQAGEKHGIVVRIDRPIIGFVDFLVELNPFENKCIDLKTSSRAQFQPNWIMQQGLYAIDPELRITQICVQLLVRTKALKLVDYNYTPNKATQAVVLSTFSWFASQAAVLEKTASEDEIACLPDYHCDWCPRATTCEAANFRTPSVGV